MSQILARYTSDVLPRMEFLGLNPEYTDDEGVAICDPLRCEIIG